VSSQLIFFVLPHYCCAEKHLRVNKKFGDLSRFARDQLFFLLALYYFCVEGLVQVYRVFEDFCR